MSTYVIELYSTYCPFKHREYIFDKEKYFDTLDIYMQDPNVKFLTSYKLTERNNKNECRFKTVRDFKCFKDIR